MSSPPLGIAAQPARSEKVQADPAVEPMPHDSEVWDELAEFLARFVCSGELHDPLPGDEKANTWRRRIDWWWKENPFCNADSPLGFLLRNESRRIVGFQGLLPIDYECEGQQVPGLLSCLFFVEKAYRAQSMGLFFRMQRLSKTYHVVDGGPSDDMVKILERFQYHRGDTRTFYFLFPNLLRSSQLPEGCRLVSSLSEVKEVVAPRDSRLRKLVTPGSLKWLCEVGRHPRSFIGIIDSANRLIAHAIGYHRDLPGPFRAWQILDYGAADEDVFSVEQLLRLGMSQPGRRNLSSPPHLIIWGIENGARHPRSWIRKEKESEVFYKKPDPLAEVEKVVLPIEGDYCFF
ncbi:MAG: hypothetical protein P1U85_12645 [Verrucomicrobiales bacterium]|nr:hypothetical protein [Verrucomicrobiales bacterium]